MKKLTHILLFALYLAILNPAHARPDPKNREYVEIRVYHFANSAQESLIDAYLQNNLVPYLHSQNLKNIGVFKAIANDTATDKRIFVLIPYKSLKDWQKLLLQPSNGSSGSAEYVNAGYDKPPYSRIETIFLRAFSTMPKLSAPKLSGPKSERVYELRSYESATERLFRNKVQMFNEGGETQIFSRLGFNAVFYGEVIYGSRMPNLMYMTSFENMKARMEHWAAFGSDPEWKKLSGMAEYQKNVSKQDIMFLRATDYSDL